jgi:hypothetical protein
MFRIPWFEAYERGGSYIRGRTPAGCVDSPMRAELRAHLRVPLRGRVVLIWVDGSHRSRRLYALARNVSGGGMVVQSYRPLPVGSFVRVRSRNCFFLAGGARVQYWSRGRLTYQIGLKFDNELAGRY